MDLAVTPGMEGITPVTALVMSGRTSVGGGALVGCLALVAITVGRPGGGGFGIPKITEGGGALNTTLGDGGEACFGRGYRTSRCHEGG